FNSLRKFNRRGRDQQFGRWPGLAELQHTAFQIVDDIAVLRIDALLQRFDIRLPRGQQIVITFHAPVDYSPAGIDGGINRGPLAAASFRFNVKFLPVYVDGGLSSDSQIRFTLANQMLEMSPAALEPI